ncbi:hypothetical protein Pres01_19170 [Metapseudomonas resinovorans]|nr:hypothetical protein Pres01_19170 [Pseudomonas resinovorans]
MAFRSQMHRIRLVLAEHPLDFDTVTDLLEDIALAAIDRGL